MLSISSITIIDGGKDYIDRETVINVVPKGIDCKLSPNVHKWNINAVARYGSILSNQTFKDTTQVASEVKLENKLVSFYPGLNYRKNLNDNIDEFDAEISGGERSEFNLLEKIQNAHHYDLLLVDEPESSFDNSSNNKSPSG